MDAVSELETNLALTLATHASNEPGAWLEELHAANPDGVDAIVDFLPVRDTVSQIVNVLRRYGTLVLMVPNRSKTSVPTEEIMVNFSYRRL